MSWWDDITPWDTANERAKKRQNEVDDVQQAIEDAYNDIAPPPEAVDDDGDGRPDRLINPETGETLQDYTRINDMLDEASAAGQSLPSYDEWLSNTGRTHTEITGSDPYQGLQQLTAQMEAGPTEGEWDDAYNHAARLMGLTGEEYYEMVGNLERQAAQGGEGFSDEERALRERDVRAQTRYAEERAQRMIENIRANSGSSTRAYMAADQALRQINDYELQQQVALADEEMRRQEADREAMLRQAEQMVGRQQMGVQQYITLLENSKARAFEGYAMQMNAVFQQNAQYLQMHQQEMGRVQQHVENMYTAINAEMGVSQHISQQIQDYYGMELAQYQAALSAITADFQLEATSWAIEDQARAGRVGAIFGGIQIVAGAALTVMGGAAFGVPLMASGMGTVAGGMGADMAMPNFTMPEFDGWAWESQDSGYPSAGSDGGIA